MSKNQSVLISGGTGLIGQELSKLLIENGFEVHILTRNPKKYPNTKGLHYHGWDPMNEKQEWQNMPKVNNMINLAGSPIIGKRWSPDYKNQIIKSRLKSAISLGQYAAQLPEKPFYLGASAIGIYGNSDEKLADETTSGSSERFIVQSVVAWEKAHWAQQDLFQRTVIFRIGLVLSSHGGMLEKLKVPAQFGLYSYLGNGEQWQSWIHIDDLCKMFLFAMENKHLSGVYNAVGPEPVRAKEWMHIMKKVKKSFGLIMPTPITALKIAFGEAHKILLDSCKASSTKIEASGFKFKFRTLESALTDLL